MQTSKQQFAHLIKETTSLSTVQKKWLRRNFLSIRDAEITVMTATLQKEHVMLSQRENSDSMQHTQKLQELNHQYDAVIQYFYTDIRPSLFRSAERRTHEQEKEQMQHWFDGT